MAVAENVIFGYYRWTNIYYGWPDIFAKKPAIQSALRTLIHPNSMCDPNHPLYSHQVQGAELWIGTLKNGKMRLMFSAAQVEFLRYYLVCNGFGKTEDIPLPDSSYLLKENVELSAVSPAHYATPEKLKHANKDIEKRNKQLSQDDRLLRLRAQFEKARNVWHAKAGNWMAIDFETWERDHKLVTELGVSVREWKQDGTLGSHEHHFIISEYTSYVNSVYVQGNRDFFSFGSSLTIPKAQVIQCLKELINTYNSDRPLFLVFHGGNDDLRILKEWNIPLGEVAGTNSTLEPSSREVHQFDTAEMFAALCGTPNERRSLERTSQLLEIPDVKYLHNAGNDAYFTMESMVAMASGGPVDIQRKARWPLSGMKKEFKPLRGDPDFHSEDEELEAMENPGQLFPPELAPDVDMEEE